MARILIVAACLCGSGALLFSQAQNASTPQSQRQSAQSAQDRKNPFESIPQTLPEIASGPGVIEGIDFRGSRRTPQDALREMILSKVGAAYKEDTVRLDVLILRDRFEDVRVSTEQGERGGVVLRFVVTERPPAQ